MKFKPNLTDTIIKELEKVPNIRYVCNKVGIDHSTFYRWLMRHPTFNKRVIMALFLGRRAISGAAETVIIKGVQKGEHRAATFWLSHNEPMYMQREKSKYYSDLLSKDMETLKMPIQHDGTNFESLFIVLKKLRKTTSQEAYEEISKMLMKALCNNDSQLISICNSSYSEWLKTKNDKTKRHHP